VPNVRKLFFSTIDLHHFKNCLYFVLYSVVKVTHDVCVQGKKFGIRHFCQCEKTSADFAAPSIFSVLKSLSPEYLRAVNANLVRVIEFVCHLSAREKQRARATETRAKATPAAFGERTPCSAPPVGAGGVNLLPDQSLPTPRGGDTTRTHAFI